MSDRKRGEEEGKRVQGGSSFHKSQIRNFGMCIFFDLG
jgi:hypothetical protein